MKKQRNPNANCGNCPYWKQMPKSNCGTCHASSPAYVEGDGQWPDTLDLEWCGQHPDFWAEEEVTDLPTVDANLNQALNEGDGQEDDSWKYHTCRECKHRGSMYGCGRFYLGRTLEFIPDKNNCPAFEEGDPKESES